MAITATTTPPSGIVSYSNGKHLDDAVSPDAASKNLGYAPRYIRVENETDRIALEWFEGMTSAYALKTIANGTRSLETSGGVTVSGNTFSFDVTQNKQYRWIALG